jgi:hypothetical protein
MPVVAVIVLVVLWAFITSVSLTTWAIVGGIVLLLAAVLIYSLYFTQSGSEFLNNQAERARAAENVRLVKETPPPEFKSSHKYIYRLNNEISKGVAVDSINKKIAIYDFGAWRIMDWRDVISCDADITENNVTHTSSSRSILGAAVGGLTFGVAGAVVGGLGGKTKSTVSSNIQKMVMRVGFKNINRPTYEIQFGNNVTEQAKSDFREWIGRMNAILVSGE